MTRNGAGPPRPRPFVGILVWPSPRDMVSALDDSERVAIDLIMQTDMSDECIWSYTIIELVYDDKKRQRLLGIARQLRSLGVTVHDRITARELEEEG